MFKVVVVETDGLDLAREARVRQRLLQAGLRLSSPTIRVRLSEVYLAPSVEEVAIDHYGAWDLSRRVGLFKREWFNNRTAFAENNRLINEYRDGLLTKSIEAVMGLGIDWSESGTRSRQSPTRCQRVDTL